MEYALPVATLNAGSSGGGSSAALAEVALSDGVSRRPRSVGAGLPTATRCLLQPPATAFCCQPTRGEPREAPGEGCGSPPSAPRSPRAAGGWARHLMWGEGLPWLPRMGKGGMTPQQLGKEPREQQGLAALEQSGVMLREVSLQSGWGRQGGCENTSAKNNQDEHKCWRDPWLRGGLPSLSGGGHGRGWVWGADVCLCHLP